MSDQGEILSAILALIVFGAIFYFSMQEDKQDAFMVSQQQQEVR